MKKMSLESILQGQLDAANKVIHQLTLQVEELTELIKSLRVEISQKDIRVSELLETLSSLELAITGKEREVIKQQNISRGLSKLVFNNTEKQSSIERKTEEKKKAANQTSQGQQQRFSPCGRRGYSPVGKPQRAD